MKHLVSIGIFVIWVVTFVIAVYVTNRDPKPAYEIRREPPIMLNRWQVTKQDSVCYTGSIADCQAWIETEKYRKTN